jgi:hypothetical protein
MSKRRVVNLLRNLERKIKIPSRYMERRSSDALTSRTENPDASGISDMIIPGSWTALWTRIGVESGAIPAGKRGIVKCGIMIERKELDIR